MAIVTSWIAPSPAERLARRLLALPIADSHSANIAMFAEEQNRPRNLTWAAILIFWLAFALMVTSIGRKSATVDEQSHLFRGVAYLQTGATHFLLGHPLLGGVLSALPLQTEAGLGLPVDDPAWAAGDWSVAGGLFLWQLNAHPLRLIFLGRLPVIWLALLLGALIFRWGRQWAGPLAGLLALALLLLDPNLLANGRLITGDLPVTFFFVLCLYAYWRWSQHQATVWSWADLRPLLLSGLGLGLAGATKFNAALLVPILALWGLVLARRRRHGRPIVALVIVGLSAWLVIWAVYGFGLWRGFLPGGAFWEDLVWLLSYVGRGHGQYLFGQASAEGWWYYFPVAFALKTPLPTLFLLAWAGVTAVWHGRSGERLFLLLPAVLYLAGSMITALNIGYRYLLPMLPLLYLLVAVRLAQSQLSVRRLRLFSAGLVGLYALLALWLWPDYLPYFNALANARGRAWLALSDSNVDWGQDLPALAAWQQEQGVPLKLSYFGTAHPSAYGLRFEALPTWPPGPEQGDPRRQAYNPADPAPGYYAISVTNLHGVVLGDNREAYADFRQATPLARPGGSIFVYKVPAHGQPAEIVLAGLRPGELDAQIQARLATNDLRVRWLDAPDAFLWPADGGWLAAGEAWTATGPLAAYWPEQAEVAAAGQLLYRLAEAPRLARANPPVGFGGKLDYMGYQRVPAPEDTVSLLTAWQVQAATDRPLKIFVHALDGDGQILAQWDGLSLAPESLRPGDRFIQAHTIVLPPGVQAESLAVGLYDGQSLERLGRPVAIPLN